MTLPYRAEPVEALRLMFEEEERFERHLARIRSKIDEACRSYSAERGCLVPLRKEAVRQAVGRVG